MDIERKARKIKSYPESVQRTIMADLMNHLVALEQLSRKFSESSIRSNPERLLEAIRGFVEGIERNADCRIEVYCDCCWTLILKRKGMI